MFELVKVTCIVENKEIKEFIERLPAEEKEQLAGYLLEKLSADSKSRILGRQIKDAGLIVVMGGSNCSISSEISVQIQSVSNTDISQIIEALAQRMSRPD